MRFTSNIVQDFAKFAELAKLVEAPRLIMKCGFKKDPESIEKLINSDFWPKAVPDPVIVRTVDAMAHRSKSILASFVGELKDKTFMDFGCGNGFCVKYAADKASMAVGFDAKADEGWSKIEALISDDFKSIKDKGPFDVILMYDVFDHIPEKDIDTALHRLRVVCHSDTVIKVRCHPWTAIHGGHVYENLNRAYAHLFMTDEQLSKHQSEYVRKITRPMKTYKDAWSNHGFKAADSKTHRINWAHGGVGDFFSQDDVTDYLASKAALGAADWQKRVLPVEFIDFTLKPA